MMTRDRAPQMVEASACLDLYLQEIKGAALLSAAEERELASEIARGSRQARTRMIESNLRLVVKIARDYVGRGLSLDDLIGEGNLGLIRASEEYDPEFGTRFSTYASYWIRQAIGQAVMNTGATIRIPAHMIALLTKWRAAERALFKEVGEFPTDEMIAERLGLSDSQRGLVDQARKTLRLRRESGCEEWEPWSAEEAADRREGIESRMEVDELREGLMERMERLDEREREVIMLRFGLEDGTPKTLKEVGIHLGVTREWVRKIELKAVTKLNDASYDEMIRLALLTPVVPEPPPPPRRRSRKPVKVAGRTASRRRAADVRETRRLPIPAAV